MELADVCQRRMHLIMLCLHPLGQELIDKAIIHKCIGLLGSVFRAIVNRSRACPPLFWRAALNSLGRWWLCQE